MAERFDIIIVGGGIYGACIALEASRRGYRSLLVERNDFGGATSFNSLRIIHGGLRYLQSMDMPRFIRSVREQSWWLETFPDLVQTMPCLMPLYGKGLRNTSVMGCALRVNDWLAFLSDKQFRLEKRSSKIIDRHQTIDRFPKVDQVGLRGAAAWIDAHVVSPQRLLIEILRWAAACGCRVLNYMGVTSLIETNRRVYGIRARCHVTGKEFEFHADETINCAGPWVAEVACDSKLVPPHEFSRAFNLLVNREPLAHEAIALSSRTQVGRTFFAVPKGSKTLLGTVHLAPSKNLEIGQEAVARWLEELNRIVPSWNLQPADVIQTLIGRLHPKTMGSPLPSRRPRIHLHATHGGPKGLTSVIGAKYTTARWVAERTLRKIATSSNFRLQNYHSQPRPDLSAQPTQANPAALPAHELQRWVQQESVIHIDDLLQRRCDLDLSPSDQTELAVKVLSALGWTQERCDRELARMERLRFTVLAMS